MLTTVTFTGVDERTDVARLLSMAEACPILEFGILVGSQSGGSPLFPPLYRLPVFRELNQKGYGRWAIHLCGQYARAAAGDPDFSVRDFDGVLDMCAGFSRVQINLHGDFLRANRIVALEDYMMHFIEQVECEKVILQHRGILEGVPLDELQVATIVNPDWKNVPFTHPKLEYLFDRSEGSGLEGFHLWPNVPEPDSGISRVGYAGGLHAGNMRQALDFLYTEENWQFPTWLDMEGRIRTNGWMDIEKVAEVVRELWDYEAPLYYPLTPIKPDSAN